MEVVTVLVPVHNEAETIEDLFFSFDSLLRENSFKPKFLVVNDASSDGTLEEIRRLRETRGYQISILNLKFNVGQHASLVVGARHLQDTDFVLVTDADLQNPPETVIPMIHQLKAGSYNIIYGLRRQNRLGNGFLSKIFWLTISLFSFFRIPPDQTPLKVFDREFIEGFKKLGSYSFIFFPYNLARVRAKVGFYPVTTRPRKKGLSKYNLLSKAKLFAKVWATIIFGYGFDWKVEVLETY